MPAELLIGTSQDNRPALLPVCPMLRPREEHRATPGPKTSARALDRCWNSVTTLRAATARYPSPAVVPGDLQLITLRTAEAADDPERINRLNRLRSSICVNVQV